MSPGIEIDFNKDPVGTVRKLLRTGLMTTQMFNSLREEAHKIKTKEVRTYENTRH